MENILEVNNLTMKFGGLTALENFDMMALVFNCSTGPKDMALRLEDISKISRFPVFAMPNAGLPDENGK